MVTCRLLLCSKHYPVYSLNVASMWLKLGRLYMGLENKAAGERALRKVRLGNKSFRPASQGPVCLEASGCRLPTGHVILGRFQQVEGVHGRSNPGPSEPHTVLTQALLDRSTHGRRAVVGCFEESSTLRLPAS